MLSVLIVNWKTKDKLAACLHSLTQFPPSCEHEIIVVDNDSGDGSAEMVRESFPQVFLIEPGANTGYAMGNNIAFHFARGDFLLTLNPDTEFIDNSLDLALEELNCRPEFGVLSIQLLFPDGASQRSVRGFPTILGLIGSASKLDRIFPNSKLASYSLPLFDHTSSGPAPQPMGTFLMFRREALAKIGDPRRPFDEAFPIFFNEVDLLFRLHKAGWPCWHFAGAKTLHHHGSSTKLVKKSMIWESHWSLVRYLKKHTIGSERLLLPLAMMLSFAAAFVRARGFHAGFRPEHHHLQLEHDR